MMPIMNGAISVYLIVVILAICGASTKQIPAPTILAAAMDQAGVRKTYDSFTFGARKAILTWLVMAKRDSTRSSRIAKTIEALEHGESPLG